MKEKAIEAIRKADKPVGNGFLATALGVAWATARAIMQELLLEKRIQSIQTSNGSLYFLPGKLEAIT
jgi:hypothetical protein